jgi:hypothetical protein
MGKEVMGKELMGKELAGKELALVCLMLGALTAPTLAQNAVPNLVGAWKGESESVVLGGGNVHHGATAAPTEPEFRSLAFTLTIEKQDGRRFFGTFASARGSSKELGVIGRNGSIYLVDAEGQSEGTMLSPTQIDLCYLKQSSDARIASCTVLTKQP